ncbi:alkylated DNA repair protein alkB homolog 8-like isoform X2 [Eriocheir sinensis]|uniref:alkylated DNA repair protein alkB homolog 8-like isoform X2 n=1 Tax=Eriocheir sinensis TaxID=95602 RepID=UPI0021C92D7E|nr:alkylated DNA repair protein alkB homolog 8-like isoform X2 [Eriocheir sinensis]
MEGCRRDWNKVKKKITRCIAILQRDLPDIYTSEHPTKHIFIGNAGLTTNADESSLVELITSVGCGLEALTLLPGKQYSFASFTTPEQARTVIVAAHGHLAVRGSTSPVYMAYVDKVPLDPSPIKFRFPPGLSVIEDFVSPKEELQLMNLVDWGATPSCTAQGSVMKHRQVRHFGYEFQYSTNRVDKGRPLAQGLPPAIDYLLWRIVERGCMPSVPDQLTINRYLPGQGIPPHVDTHSSFTDELLSLSLGGGVNMDFRYIGGSGGNGNGEGSKDKPPHYVVYLPSRSLCVMTGPARYEWSHGICPRMTDVVASRNSATGLQLLPRRERISFTFRKIRQGECTCNNANICDSYSKKQKSCSKGESKGCPTTPGEAPTDRSAARLEKEHVLEVYDQIAEHFSVTRHKPWPQVLEFVLSLPLGSMLLDVGCGNGKYMGHNKQVFQAGCDTSFELMKICNGRGFEVLTCNCLHLPYRDSIFDAVVCIAVIHHLATEGRRLAAVREMVRVLSVGGRGLIYVWAMEQRHGDKKSTYLKQNKEDIAKDDNNEESMSSNKPQDRADAGKTGAASLPVHVNRTEFVQQDMLVPWKLKPPRKYEAKCERRRCDRGCGVSHSCRNKKAQDTCDPGVDTLQITSNCGVLAAQENVRCDNCHSKSRKKAACAENRADQVFHRYYHVFKQGELELLCSQLNVRITKSFYDEGNWCVIFQKVS